MMSQISADWEAVDTGGVPYALHDRETFDGVAAHRRFRWAFDPSSTTIQATGDVEYVEHENDVIVHLRRLGLTAIEWAGFVDTQKRLLRGLIEQRTDWPEGVQDVEVVLTSVDTNDERTELTYTVRALISHDVGGDVYSEPLAWEGPSSDYLEIDPTIDVAFGDGEQTFAEVALYPGDWVWNATIWSDTATADACNVTVALKLGATTIATLTTSATSADEQSAPVAITASGTYTLTIKTDAIAGVGRIDASTLERVS